MDTVVLHPAAEPRVTVQVLSQRDPAMLARCLGSIATTVQRETPYEVVLVLNGAAPDVVHWTRRHLRGATVSESPVNLGFAGGHRHAARHASPSSEFLLLLNDDAVVEPGWLEALLAAADELPRAGVLGSRIGWPDGRMQEAGSVLWDDGSTMPLGRDLDPLAARQWMWRRRTDYVSFASALVRRSAWDEVGGLDLGYFPAYYEDVDFSLLLREAGWETWYEPSSPVLHLESASTVTRFKSFLFRRNGARFRDRWAHLLPGQVHAEPWEPAAVQAAMDRAAGIERRVLVVDDRVPDPSEGSGLQRAADMVRALAAEPGTHVALHATNGHRDDPLPVGRLGVEVVPGSKDDLRAHLALPHVRYDAVVVSRPHNWDWFQADLRRTQPQAPLVYDAEALWHVRIARQAAYIRHPGNRANVQRFADDHRAFEAVVPLQADHAVTINPEEQAFFEAQPGHCPVSLVPPQTPDVAPTAEGVATRRDLLLTAGWGSGADSPNGDGLRWFAAEVLPKVVAAVPWVELRVTGARPPAELLHLAGPNLRFLGHVDDLREEYARARVVVAPMRFGAGVKLKTIGALQHGVPTVATVVGAEGVPLHRGDELDVTDDPAAFAEAVVRLLTDDTHWQARREAVLALPAHWETAPGSSWAQVLAEVRRATPRTDVPPSPRVDW